LEDVATRFHLFDETSFLSLAVHEDHEHQCGGAETDEDDDEGTESPAPAVLVVEQVGNRRSGKGACDTRGSVEREDNHAIPQRGAICRHDVGNE
jgi:hypothetical protein